MSRYRETMSEALKKVYAIDEDNSYLMPKLNPTQIMNIKKTWSMKTAKDVTPAVKDMIKKMEKELKERTKVRHSSLVSRIKWCLKQPGVSNLDSKWLSN